MPPSLSGRELREAATLIRAMALLQAQVYSADALDEAARHIRVWQGRQGLWVTDHRHHLRCPHGLRPQEPGWTLGSGPTRLVVGARSSIGWAFKTHSLQLPPSVVSPHAPLSPPGAALVAFTTRWKENAGAMLREAEDEGWSQIPPETLEGAWPAAPAPAPVCVSGAAQDRALGQAMGQLHRAMLADDINLIAERGSTEMRQRRTWAWRDASGVAVTDGHWLARPRGASPARLTPGDVPVGATPLWAAEGPASATLKSVALTLSTQGARLGALPDSWGVRGQRLTLDLGQWASGVAVAALLTLVVVFLISAALGGPGSAEQSVARSVVAAGSVLFAGGLVSWTLRRMLNSPLRQLTLGADHLKAPAQAEAAQEAARLQTLQRERALGGQIAVACSALTEAPR